MNYRTKNFLRDFAVYAAALTGFVLYVLMIVFVMGLNVVAGFILMAVTLAAIFAAIDNFF